VRGLHLASLLISVCTYCAAFGEVCSFNISSRPRGPSKAYVQKLESQVKEMEEARLVSVCDGGTDI